MTDTTFAKPTKTEVEPTRASAARRWSPPVDIFENADGFLIVADLPGVEPAGLTVEYSPPELLVSGRVETKADGGSFVYERRFEVGTNVDPQSISAELKQGVLRIDLKKSAALRPRKIAVRST